MPLPPSNIAWPPRELSNITPVLDAWSSWYAGDTQGLERAYGGQSTERMRDRPSQYRGGVVGGVARWFWGAPRGDLTQPKAKLHVPIAADLCQASADLLYAEPPTFTVDDETTQDRLTELTGEGMHTTLAEGAEIAAALGSVYMRVTWDREVVPDMPFLTSVHADAAWPEFRWGHLIAVTFWHIVARDGRQVYRHLERHELDLNRVGHVLHGLYLGTEDNLGRAIPLTENPATAGLVRQLGEDGTVDTQSPGLAVVHVRNQGPQRRFRNDMLGAHLGRSDLDGVEPFMDALDETYTSWMRDIRLGKARVFVARSMLDNAGPGQGSTWDSDREMYAPVEMLATGEGKSLPIQVEQFKIRYEEHRATAEQLREDILRTAGYSVQTFGSDDVAGDRTATEVQSRERRSYLTRDRKIRLQRPQVAAIAEKLLAVDAAVFSSGVTVQTPNMTYADSVQESMLSLAQTAAALSAARAASTQTLVALIHPDWDDTQVADEVARISAEQSVTVPDPTTFDGLNDPAGQ